MATLYLDRKGLELRLDGGAIALYDGGIRCRTVPLALLDRLVVRAETTLSSSVLGAVAESGCPVVILSGRHGRRLAVVHGRRHNDASLRLAQYAKAFDSEFRLQWARRFIAGKLYRQIRLLNRVGVMRPDCHKAAFDALETLGPLRERVLRGDVATVDTLRGIEGAGQAAYFRAFAALFADSLGFRTRNRRPPRDPVNACLSLGYTLTHFEAVRVSHEAGLDPLLGFFHETAFGRESLACDLMEPVRPLVDGWLWEMFRTRALRTEDFSMDKGACVLGKAGRLRFYERFEEFLNPASRRLRVYCRLLARALRSEAPCLATSTLEEDEEP